MGVVCNLRFSVMWQGLIMSGDYWLAYETSSARASSFDHSFFLSIYSAIAAMSIGFIALRASFLAFSGLKTCQILFSRLLQSFTCSHVFF